MRFWVSLVRILLVLTLWALAVVMPSPSTVCTALTLTVLFTAFDKHNLQHVATLNMGVDSSTYLADAKLVYGTLQDQVSTLAAIMNLFGDGGKFGKPINAIGIRGYVFLARLQPNWNMGYRPEGTTGVGQAGNQGLQNATVQLRYAYVPVTITGQAENLTKGESKAFMQAKALEIKFDMKDIVSHVNVVVAGAERGGQLAQVQAGSGAANSFIASTTGLLPAAIYLRVGMPIDAAPVGGGALSLQGATITAINYGTRTVTHNSPAVATDSHAIALQGEYPNNAGAFPYTSEGLVSLISDSGAIQGLDPATAGMKAWSSFLKDVGAVQLSSQLLHEQKAFTKNRGGEDPDMFLFPTAQINQLVAIATTTIRFDIGEASPMGKKALDLGFEVYEYAGLPIIEDKDLRTDRIYCGASEMMKKFEAVPLSLAEDEAGSWTRMSGANGIADAIMGLLRWYHQIGIVQRSAWSVYKNYTVPTSFQTAAPTL